MSSTSGIMKKSDPGLVFSANFQAADADVVYCSSDGVRFRIHSKNLAITSGVLNPGTMDLQAEVHLTEPANILELLFQCVYPRRQSDISQLSPEDLFALGEAVEKYEIFPAMELCRLYIKTLAQSHPILTLGFGFKHGYPDLVDDAALYTMNYPLSTVVSALPDHAVLPWVGFPLSLVILIIDKLWVITCAIVPWSLLFAILICGLDALLPVESVKRVYIWCWNTGKCAQKRLASQS
ncbi:hypothetical protein BD779DRAFT_1527329 [Infundibulicybe gibba]|nr:hypothetical protein BD779DRAFT_1527329 [Infundibulicybe gibba]